MKLAYDDLECCDAMKRAQREGTDNEGYGAAVSFWPGQGWRIGLVDQNIAFCPWCGAAIEAAKGGKK